MKHARTCVRFVTVFAAAALAVTVPRAQAQDTEFRTQVDVRPYNPANDADIDLYIRNWREVPAFRSHGSLVEREVFSQGSQMKPERRGCCLEYVNRFTRAVLYARNRTEPFTPKGEQEIYYIYSGTGKVASQKSSAEISAGYFVLVPDGVEFTMENTGGDPLEMYLIAEPVTRDDFTPHDDIVVVDENKLPVLTTTGHWSMIIKQAYKLSDDLCIIEYVNTITIDPMTICHPHAHYPGCEEVWTMVEGESLLFLGKQLRVQKTGDAYYCPPYGNCPHSNINNGEKPVKLLYFAVRADWTAKDGIKRTK